MDQKYCVIVDAYGSTSYLPAEFIKRGYACIHVASPGGKGEYYLKSFRPEDFALIIEEQHDMDKIVAELMPYPIACVVAGTDAAVLLADTLAARLGLKQNDLTLSQARRYKDKMAERLAEVGLPHIPHIKSSDSDEIIAWANQGDHWPI
ncbi:MAG TPA: phosphoribosylglycinamide synthetase, partial [Gammaproteobacteria bacterium]|nr:phosphoribosylglycinamide synthetase [Gammaproteobacteria bacterium]